jgi:glycine oxidase
LAAPDVVIVGGGVVGCSVAWSLAREGLAVTLLERHEIAGEASGAAAGMLAPIVEAPEQGAFLEFGLRSLGMFPALVDELRERTGVDAEYEPSGVLRIAADPEEAGRLRARAGRGRALGLEWLDREAAREMEPGLGAGVAGALWSPREAHLRSAPLTRAFARAAAESGARIRTGTAVLGLERRGERIAGVRTPEGRIPAGVVVVCAGAFTPECLASVGAASFAPVEPVRGQLLTLVSPRPGPRTILWRGSLYLVPKRDGSVVVGATEERVGFERRVTAAGVLHLLERAFALLPGLADFEPSGSFAGLRPCTPDRLPVIGPVPGLEGLLVAAGHFRNGVLLAPATAALVTDRVLGKEPWAGADAFLPARFCC